MATLPISIARSTSVGLRREDDAALGVAGHDRRGARRIDRRFRKSRPGARPASGTVRRRCRCPSGLRRRARSSTGHGPSHSVRYRRRGLLSRYSTQACSLLRFTLLDRRHRRGSLGRSGVAPARAVRAPLGIDLARRNCGRQSPPSRCAAPEFRRSATLEPWSAVVNFFKIVKSNVQRDLRLGGMNVRSGARTRQGLTRVAPAQIVELTALQMRGIGITCSASRSLGAQSAQRFSSAANPRIE